MLNRFGTNRTVTSSNSSVILRMISAFCMFLNISILTVPGHRRSETGFSPHVWHRLAWLCGGSCAGLTFTPRALDEKVDEVQQRQVPVLFVGLDPLVHHRLSTHRHSVFFLSDPPLKYLVYWLNGMWNRSSASIKVKCNTIKHQGSPPRPPKKP